MTGHGSPENDSNPVSQSMDGSSSPHAVRVAMGMVAGFGIVASLVGPFLTPVLRRHILPYIPATPDQIQRACRLARVGLGARPECLAPSKLCLIDIGSGDGRVVFNALKELPQVSTGHGVEVNRWLVYWARAQAIRQGLAGRTHFRAQNMWTLDFSGFDLVFVFGVPSLMAELEIKLQAELKHGGAVVATRFPFPNWEPYRRDGLSWLYLATTPPRR